MTFKQKLDKKLARLRLKGRVRPVDLKIRYDNSETAKTYVKGLVREEKV